MIPKIIVQTSKVKPNSLVIDKLRSFVPSWEYQHFTDEDIVNFFEEHPDRKFPNIKQKFFKLSIGQHRADLFRYYYLYKKGGVYIDTDAMLCDSIEWVSKYFDFFTVLCTKRHSIFNGFIGSCSNNQIILEALNHLYHSQPQDWKKYTFACDKLYQIIEPYKKNNNVFLYREFYNGGESIVKDNDGKKILIHYFMDKVIPI